MAEWNKGKVLPSAINGGQEFTKKDILAVYELNAIVNNSFYAVEKAERAEKLVEDALSGKLDLTEYYTKDETYSKKEVDNLIANIESGGGTGSTVIVDSELNNASENPVQNKVIASEIDQINSKINELLASIPRDVFNGEDYVLVNQVQTHGKSSGETFNGISDRQYQYYSQDDLEETSQLFDLLSNKSSGVYKCVLDFTSYYLNYSTEEILSEVNSAGFAQVEYLKGDSTNTITITTEDVFKAKNGSTTISKCGISIELQKSNVSSFLRCRIDVYFPTSVTSQSYADKNGFTVKLRDLVI